jgi:hypothetical protein
VPLVKDGKLRALAVAANVRAAALPDIRTLDEAGFKGQEADTFQAMLIQAATPKEIQDLLHREALRLRRSLSVATDPPRCSLSSSVLERHAAEALPASLFAVVHSVPDFRLPRHGTATEIIARPRRTQQIPNNPTEKAGSHRPKT